MQIPGNLQELIQLLIHVLIQAVPFYIVVFAMSKLVFKPVLAVLAERERRMVGDKEDARDFVKRAEEKIKEYEDKIYKAKSEAKDIKSAIIKEALGKEREILAKAREAQVKIISDTRARLFSESKELMPRLQQESKTLAQDIAASVMGRAV